MNASGSSIVASFSREEDQRDDQRGRPRVVRADARRSGVGRSDRLAGRAGWDEARVRAALLSNEALSGAALAIHHVQQSIKRSLGQRLGSLKEVKLS